MILEFAKHKRAGLCPVKGCRNKRSPEHYKHGGVCPRCWMRAWRASNPVRDAWNNLRNSARRRGKLFGITFKEFVQWCAQTSYIELRGHTADCAHIDRIDFRRGYTLDNIQILTCSENSTKGNYEKRAMHAEKPF